MNNIKLPRPSKPHRQIGFSTITDTAKQEKEVQNEQHEEQSNQQQQSEMMEELTNNIIERYEYEKTMSFMHKLYAAKNIGYVLAVFIIIVYSYWLGYHYGSKDTTEKYQEIKQSFIEGYTAAKIQLDEKK